MKDAIRHTVLTVLLAVGIVFIAHGASDDRTLWVAIGSVLVGLYVSVDRSGR